jgi:photosystem II stability/assembly factor-like uncharacterized protein
MSRRHPLPLVLVALCLLSAAPSAGAVVSTGHSGWGWADPSPQGETIADLTFAGDVGYAVGGYGTLLRTVDGGASWTGLPSRTVQDLTRVGPAGPTGVVASGACALRRSGDSGATFGAVDVGGGDTGCGSSIRAVSFPDAQNGMILLATGIVLTTSDGGVSLARRTPVPGGFPTDLVAVSPTTAYATSGPGIYRTTDGAASWTLVALAPRTLHSIAFASATTAVAVGDGGTVVRSLDAGATWAARPTPGTGLDLLRVRCADDALCLFVTTSGVLVRTADSGATYAQVTPAASPVRAVAFASSTRVVAAGDAGVMAVSDDAGVTWRPIGSTLGAGRSVVTSGGGDFAYTVSPSAIALTTDGGATWRSVAIPTARSITAAAFADPLTGFAQDDGGVLRRTLDGGVTWQVLDPGPVTTPLQRMIALGSGRVILVYAGGMARSTDGGVTFRSVASAALRRARVLSRGIVASAGAGRVAIVVGRGAIVRTRDAGATWTRVPVPRAGARPPRIARADCVPPGTCWIVTAGSRLYRTVNAGGRWVDVTAGLGVPTRSIRDVAAGARGEVFLALGPAPRAERRALVLHTRDGGRTWAPQLLGRGEVLSVDATPGRAWALTGAGGVLTTTTGGRAPVASTLSLRATPARARRGAPVVVRGRLRGAAGGEVVTLYVSGRPPRALTVSSAGTFTASVRIARTSRIVAHWEGDGVRAGAGTPALTVPLRR